MQLSDPAVEASRASVRLKEPLSAALQALYRAIHKSAIYPSGHPSIPEAVRKVIQGLEEALDNQTSVLVGVAREHLLLDNERLTESSGTLRSLAMLWHQLDLAAVEFHAGLSAEELEALVAFLGRSRRDQLRGGTLVEALAHEPIQHVRLCPIDYRALRFAEGTQQKEGEREEPKHDPWEILPRLLTDPAAYAREGGVQRVAEEVCQEIERCEGAGLGALREQVQQSVRRIKTLRQDQQSAIRQRLAAFIAGLNPELRADLLSVEAASSRMALNLLNELAEDLPLADLLGALQQVDRTGNRVPDEMLSLLNKLARISERRPQEAPLVQQTLERWGISAPASLRPADPRETLSEVLQKRADIDYNPASYRTLLAGLSRENLAGVVQASALRYRDSTDSAVVRQHTTEIAVQLLARADGDEYRKSLLAHVQGATDFLIDRGGFETIYEATLAARAHSVLEIDCEDTRRAARCYLDEFTRTERIDRILAHVRRSGTVNEDALAILALGGAAALDAVLDLLASPLSAAAAETLWRFAGERGAEVLARVIEMRSERGQASLGPVFVVLRELPKTHAVPLLEQVAEHDDFRVRRDALRLLCEIDDRPGSPENHLRRGLCDESPRVVGFALQKLAELSSVASLELLGEYVEFGLPGVTPQPSFSYRAAHCLAAKGDRGCERLCQALRAVTRSVRPRHARTAKMLVGVLEGNKHNPIVRRSIRHWHFSTNRLVAMLVAKHRPGPDVLP